MKLDLLQHLATFWSRTLWCKSYEILERHSKCPDGRLTFRLGSKYNQRQFPQSVSNDSTLESERRFF